jgi:hypothetical protein
VSLSVCIFKRFCDQSATILPMISFFSVSVFLATFSSVSALFLSSLCCLLKYV